MFNKDVFFLHFKSCMNTIECRLSNYFFALDQLKTLTEMIFSEANPDSTNVNHWIDSKFGVDEDGFFQPLQDLRDFRNNKLSDTGMSYFWQPDKNDDIEIRKRIYALRNFGETLKKIRKSLDGAAWIYYQDIENVSIQYPYIDMKTAITPDFNWLEYHTFKTVEPDINPDREIRWTKPTIDYAGEGLIISASIPVYVKNEFVGLWSIDTPVKSFFSEDIFESFVKHHRYLLTNKRGEILSDSSVSDIPIEEKGKIIFRKIDSLGKGFGIKILDDIAENESFSDILKDNSGEDLIVYSGYIKSLNWFLLQIFPLSQYIEFVEANAKLAISNNNEEKFNLEDLIRSNAMLSVYDNIIYTLKAQSSENKRISKELSDKTEEFRLITQLPGQITYNYHPCTGRISWTGDIEGVTGYSVEAFSSYSFDDWTSKLHPDDKVRTIETLDKAIREESTFESVYRFLKEDGTYGHIEDMGFIIKRHESGEKVMLGIMRDVTERVETENSLIQSEKKFRALYDNAPLAYQSLDENGNLIDVNPAWQKTLGYDDSDVIGQSFADLLHEDWKQHFDKNFPAFKKRGFINGVEFKIRHKKGHYLDIAFDGMIGTKQDGSFKQTYCVFRDISVKKRVEKAIEKRIIALTEPITSTGNITFESLFNVQEIQKLQDDFARAYGIASVIMKPSGKTITIPSNVQNICQMIIGNKELCEENCVKFVKGIGNSSGNKPLIKRCPVTGLLDAGTKIMIHDKHIATWLIGQVKDTDLQEKDLTRLAAENKIGVNEFRTAYNELPITGYKKFNDIAQLMFTLANQLSQKAYQNIQQARMISHLKDAKNLLKHYETIVSNSTNMLALISKNMEYLVVNRNYAITFIPGIEDFQGMSIYNAHADNEFTEILKSNLSTCLSGEITEFKAEIANPDRKVFEFTISPYYNENKEISGAVIAARDVSKKVEALEMLRKLSTAVTQSPSLILITDDRGKIDYVNPKFTEVTGFKLDDIKGQTPDMLRPDNENSKIYDEMHKIILKGRVWQGEMQTKKKNGDLFWTLSNVSPVFDENWNITNYMNVAEDITKLKEDECMRANLTQQLNHHTKMEALGQLAGGVAHDFNNMLSGIMGSVQLLKSPKRNLDDKAKKLLAMIQQLTVRAADLTSKLLAFSRDEESQSQSLNIHQIIVDTVSILKNTNIKMIDIDILPEAEDDIISGHSSAIQNALMNLCINSTHALNESGFIKISTQNKVLDQEFCYKSPFEIDPGLFVEIKVEDNGKGVSPQNVARIFEPFFTTKGKDEGTGLGLSIVYSTVVEHRGTISIESEVGKGTCVTILLPCSINKVRESVVSQEIPRGKGTILLVDDEYSIRVTGRFILEELGYRVILAEDGTEGVELFSEKKDEIDLVILDMIMPKMNGTEAFLKIKEIRNDVPIILSTGYTTVSNLEELNRRGLEGFIKKPYQTHELSAILTKLLNN